MRLGRSGVPLIALWAVGCAWVTNRELERRTDLDQDGFGNVQFGGSDCDDGDPEVHPGVEDPPYDGLDADCDGWNDNDADRDGWSDFDADHDGHDAPQYGGDDCDDEDPTRYPGADDPPYDGEDSACDGDEREYDVDGDGFEPDLEDDGLDPDEDCDDGDPDVYPGAPGDQWYDLVDTNCDGANDCDKDGDGYDAEVGSCGGYDCNDNDRSINPGATENPLTLTTDEDCNGNPLG